MKCPRTAAAVWRSPQTGGWRRPCRRSGRLGGGAGRRYRKLPIPKRLHEPLLAFSPDGRTLAAAVHEVDSDTTSLMVWELATGRVRCEFRGVPAPATALAFSPDGRFLASAHA